MEDIKTGEQPSVDELVQVADAKNFEGTQTSPSGSPYGKFKDSESLLFAYNNLQAEFTKKCQKLSELEKSEQDVECEKTPIYLSDDWNSKVSNFLSENEDAKQFANEICNEILIDPSLKSNEKALDIAFSKVMKKHYKLPNEITGDTSFMENYVMNNEQIKQKIIAEYITELAKNKVPPILSQSQGGEIAFVSPKAPITMDEARKQVEAIFIK